jgi:hypothetical protein
MKSRFAIPLLGVVAAIAVTTFLDATGRTVFSALPLLPLAGLLWYAERLSRCEVGLVWGKPRAYGLALLYPVVVLGAVAAIAVLFGHAYVDAARLPKVLFSIAVISLATIPLGLLTEEGFFRGWLWGSLSSRGMRPAHVLIATSVAFAVWHLSYVTLAKGFTLPPAQVALFIVNAALIGGIWGLMRARSGSIVVTSVSHSVWNGVAYTLFGEGPKPGAFGPIETIIFAPEIGIVGLAANLIFLAVLFRWKADRV